MKTVLACILAAPLLAAAPSAPVRAVDYEPSLSADGRLIAFVSNREGPLKLFVMNADGSNVRRLAEGANEDDNPAISPDGRTVAYVSITEGNADIYLVDIDGGAPRRITSDAAPDIHPNWSPDGARLLFNTLRNPGDPNHIDIYEMNADGADPRQLTSGLSASYASYAPDGAAILTRAMFGDNSDIALLSPRGELLARLTTDPAFDGWPSWSPDGHAIVFARERGGEDDNTADLFLIDADGRNERLLLAGPGRKTNPRWSPDGTILYSHNDASGVRLERIVAPSP